MTTQDPHTAPDLANYGTGMGPEYEWLISDHPWAAAERARRASEYFASELDDEPEAVEEPAPGEPHPIAEEEISGVPAELAESVGGLAEPAVDPTADPHQLAYTVGEAEPDDLAVPRYRREYVEYRREHGEPDYVYPDHYVGETAAQYPPPGLSVPR
jgi:hypothetical protein